MIYVGIDDTDAPGTRGTNQLARALAAHVARRWACVLIVRHQLLEDPRVPCTSKNGSASILLAAEGDREQGKAEGGRRKAEGGRRKAGTAAKRWSGGGNGAEYRSAETDQVGSSSVPLPPSPFRLSSRSLNPQIPESLEALTGELRDIVGSQSAVGSDPGLCVAATVPPEIADFGRRCQREFVTQQEARTLAARHSVYLEGLGGTEDGVIGALAAVGLAAGGNDGRIVQIAAWPDDLDGWQSVETLQSRGVQTECLDTGSPVKAGLVDVGKHLRPNYRRGKVVLFATPEPARSERWRAVRFT